MNALELHKLIHEGVKTDHTVNAPEIRKIKPVSMSPNLIQDIIPAQVNQSQSSFPWEELVILSGVTILLIIIINEIRKSQNYNRYASKRKDQHSVNQ